MKIHCNGTYQMIPRQLMRRAGYHEFIDPRTRKISYVRTLRAGTYYPRFHAYLDITEDGFVINLHLDQKQASYKGSHAHNAEYDGDVVEREGMRVEDVINTLKHLV